MFFPDLVIVFVFIIAGVVAIVGFGGVASLAHAVLAYVDLAYFSSCLGENGERRLRNVTSHILEATIFPSDM